MHSVAEIPSGEWKAPNELTLKRQMKTLYSKFIAYFMFTFEF